jgi:2-hydroxymuconate-semialdehyde hydrolase
MHGSGTGASTLSNFRRVLEPLAANFHVLASDLVGYGKSGRKTAEPYFDMALWGRQLSHLIAMVDRPKVGLIGHSLSGALVLKAAAEHKNVAAVVTTGTMGVATTRRTASRGWVFPESKEQLLTQVQNTVLDKSLIDDGELERRLAVLNAPGYREYITRMYAGQQEAFIGASAVTEEELQAIRCPVVFMHGANDRSFSAESTSLDLSKSIPQADVLLLGQCAQSVALEHPSKFLVVAVPFFKRNLTGA